MTRHPLAGALLAGFVATHLATVTGYWYHGIFLSDLTWPTFNGLLLIPNESTLAQFWAGTAYHYATGLSFSLVFAFVIGIYLWHLVYGFNLGALYSPLPEG